jgi:hypothetical protein
MSVTAAAAHGRQRNAQQGRDCANANGVRVTFSG